MSGSCPGSYRLLGISIEVNIEKRLPPRPFRIDRLIIVLFVLLALGAGAHGWLKAHPEHDPRAPLDLNGPEGWATGTKLASLRGDPGLCRDALDRAGIPFTPLDPAGEGACRRHIFRKQTCGRRGRRTWLVLVYARHSCILLS